MPALEGNDELSEEASNEIQEQIPQEKQRGIDERLTQGEVRRIPLQQDMAHPEKRSRPQDPDVQRQAANTIQNQAGDRDMGLSRRWVNIQCRWRPLKVKSRTAIADPR